MLEKCSFRSGIGNYLRGCAQRKMYNIRNEESKILYAIIWLYNEDNKWRKMVER